MSDESRSDEMYERADKPRCHLCGSTVAHFCPGSLKSPPWVGEHDIAYVTATGDKSQEVSRVVIGPHGIASMPSSTSLEANETLTMPGGVYAMYELMVSDALRELDEALENSRVLMDAVEKLKVKLSIAAFIIQRENELYPSTLAGLKEDFLTDYQNI